MAEFTNVGKNEMLDHLATKIGKAQLVGDEDGGDTDVGISDYEGSEQLLDISFNSSVSGEMSMVSGELEFEVPGGWEVKEVSLVNSDGSIEYAHSGEINESYSNNGYYTVTDCVLRINNMT